MSTSVRSQLLRVLHSRSNAIADSWYRAVARTSFVPLDRATVRQRFVELTEEAIALLFVEPFERSRAEAIGASLAELHYVQPETLGRTQDTLAHQFVEGLSFEQVVALQPCLAALLGGLATGFFRQAREIILIEQEQIRRALVTGLQQAEEALRRHAERLEILHEIDAAILTVQSLEGIAQAALRYIRQLVPCLRASVVLFDFEASESQQLAVHVDGDTNVEAGACLSLEGAEEAIETLRRGEVRVVDDILSHSHPSLLVQAMKAEGLRSCLAVPLASWEELIGCLCLWSDLPGAFDPDHVQVARELANSLTVAICNARLFQSVKQQGEQLRALAARLADAEEAERRRLAHELHDRVGKNLTALSINLNLVRAHIPEETVGLALSRLDDSLALVEETAERIRDVMADLRPPMLDDYGLVATLHWYGARFATWTGAAVTVEGEDPVPRLAASVEIALFRIAEEVLTNVAKHARATHVLVTVAVDDETVRLVIADDGVGFDPAKLSMPDGDRGWGLVTMAERAEAVGGRFRVESRPRQGTRVTVEVAR